MFINWRGHPAEVVRCWSRAADADDGFLEPVGAVIQWTEAGQQHRCRLVWPDTGVLAEAPPEDREAIVAAALEAALEAAPVTLWGD